MVDERMIEPFALTTQDPRFNALHPVTVNGFEYVPADVETKPIKTSAAMSPIERAARALYERWLQDPDIVREAALNGPYPTWDSISELGKGRWVNAVRAVLHAIREPSDEMCRLPSIGRDANAEEIWQAMIDAALQED